jgi:hypothetical protein
MIAARIDGRHDSKAAGMYFLLKSMPGAWIPANMLQERFPTTCLSTHLAAARKAARKLGEAIEHRSTQEGRRRLQWYRWTQGGSADAKNKTDVSA